MAVAIFASCKSPTQNPTPDGSESSDQGSLTPTESEESGSSIEHDTEKPETDSSVTDSNESSATHSPETEESETSEPVGPTPDKDTLENKYADSILYADSIKGGVQSYYPDGVKRDSYYVENLNMSARFDLTPASSGRLTYLKNSSGATYIQDTMDVFVRMKEIGRAHV